MANKIITLTLLSEYTTLTMSAVDKKIQSAIDNLGTGLRICGTKTTYEELEAVENAQNGDMWTVGTTEDAEHDEYYYIDGRWEYMGTTAPVLTGYATKADLYAGVDGTGTISEPAAGTAFAIYKQLIATNTAAIDAINDEETGLLADANAYTDEKDQAMGERVTNLETAVNGLEYANSSDIQGLFTGLV